MIATLRICVEQNDMDCYLNWSQLVISVSMESVFMLMETYRNDWANNTQSTFHHNSDFSVAYHVRPVGLSFTNKVLAGMVTDIDPNAHLPTMSNYVCTRTILCHLLFQLGTNWSRWANKRFIILAYFVIQNRSPVLIDSPYLFKWKSRIFNSDSEFEPQRNWSLCFCSVK